MTADLRLLSLMREKKRFYLVIEIVFVKILTMHHDYALCKSIYRDCVIKIDKIKLFANLRGKLFQETVGRSRWQELIISAKKTSILLERERHSKMNRVQFGIQ